MTNEPTPKTIRIEDGNVSVALGSDDFEKLLRTLVPEDETSETSCPIDHIIYLLGALPERNVWVDRLWWAAGTLVGLVFLYGLYSLIRNGIA
jgi:hypothetical protein